MTGMVEIVPYLSSSIARLLLIVIFLITGLKKLPDSVELSEMFPQLPNWLWPICGAWEVLVALLMWSKYDTVSIGMCYIILGGIFCSSVSLKTKEHISLVQKTHGFVLIPVGVFNLKIYRL